MAGMQSRRAGVYTGDLFEIPVPANPIPGSMDYRAVVSHLLAKMMAESGMTRFAIAAAVSELVGKEVSKYMLDAYTAESRDEFNGPAWLMPAIEVACKSTLYSGWLAGVRGGRLLIGRDALAAELGRIERQRDELGDQARSIKDKLRKGR